MDEMKLFWTFTARAQRDQIFQYWNQRNGTANYSRKLNREIRERLDLLKTNPLMGKPTKFHNTRFLVMRHYSIFYQSKTTEIIITGIWDNRKDPAKLLRFLEES